MCCGGRSTEALVNRFNELKKTRVQQVTLSKPTVYNSNPFSDKVREPALKTEGGKTGRARFSRPEKSEDLKYKVHTATRIN